MLLNQLHAYERSVGWSDRLCLNRSKTMFGPSLQEQIGTIEQECARPARASVPRLNVVTESLTVMLETVRDFIHAKAESCSTRMGGCFRVLDQLCQRKEGLFQALRNIDERLKDLGKQGKSLFEPA